MQTRVEVWENSKKLWKHSPAAHVPTEAEQPKKNKLAFVSILSQIKLLFGPLVIQLVWYILYTVHLSVGESGVYLARHFTAW